MLTAPLPRGKAKLLRHLEAHGWRLRRHTGSRHLQLVHVSGARNRQVIMAADTILATLRDNAIQGQL